MSLTGNVRLAPQASFFHVSKLVLEVEYTYFDYDVDMCAGETKTAWRLATVQDLTGGKFNKFLNALSYCGD